MAAVSVANYGLSSLSVGEFAALAGGRQCGWRCTPSLPGAAAAVVSRVQQSQPERFLALIFFFFFLSH